MLMCFTHRWKCNELNSVALGRPLPLEMQHTFEMILREKWCQEQRNCYFKEKRVASTGTACV